MTRKLTLTAIEGIPMVLPEDSLEDVVLDALAAQECTLQDGDALVLTQKIVSKMEGRTLDLNQITPSPAAEALAVETGKDARLLEAILQESSAVLRTRPGLVIVRHRLGFVCANAGIDQSNIDGGGEDGQRILLLPLDPDASAQRLHTVIRQKFGVDVGVLIIDSHGRAWRRGIVGITIGVAGFPALVDMRGKPDLFNRPLQITQIGLADEIAAAASVLMGQANESCPLVHVRGIPYPLKAGTLQELLRPEEEDLFL